MTSAGHWTDNHEYSRPEAIVATAAENAVRAHAGQLGAIPAEHGISDLRFASLGRLGRPPFGAESRFQAPRRAPFGAESSVAEIATGEQYSGDGKHDRFCWNSLPGGASFEEGHSGSDLAEGVAELVRLAHIGFGSQAERREPDGSCGVHGKRLLLGEYRQRVSLEVYRDLINPGQRCTSIQRPDEVHQSLLSAVHLVGQGVRGHNIVGFGNTCLFDESLRELDRPGSCRRAPVKGTSQNMRQRTPHNAGEVETAGEGKAEVESQVKSEGKVAGVIEVALEVTIECVIERVIEGVSE